MYFCPPRSIIRNRKPIYHGSTQIMVYNIPNIIYHYFGVELWSSLVSPLHIIIQPLRVSVVTWDLIIYHCVWIVIMITIICNTIIHHGRCFIILYIDGRWAHIRADFLRRWFVYTVRACPRREIDDMTWPPPSILIRARSIVSSLWRNTLIFSVFIVIVHSSWYKRTKLASCRNCIEMGSFNHLQTHLSLVL